MREKGLWMEQVIPKVSVLGTDLSLWQLLTFPNSRILDQGCLDSDRDGESLSRKRKIIPRVEVGYRTRQA